MVKMYIYQRPIFIGQKVVRFIHFPHVSSHFGFLYLVKAEKGGNEIPKKNSLIIKWSYVKGISSVMDKHEAGDSDHLRNALESLGLMIDCHDLPHFLQALMQMLHCTPKAWRFDKHTLILAVELHNIWPAAYKMLHRSVAIITLQMFPNVSKNLT